MQPLVTSFVLPLIFIGALRNTYCGVLQSEVTVYEKNDVVLPCFTTLDMKVEWRIHSKFQRTQIGERYDSRQIYSTVGLMRSFDLTGRYSVSEGNGFYNLTIANVNMSETGEYICHEELAAGNRSSTKLTVLVNVSSFKDPKRLWSTQGHDEILECHSTPFNPVRWLFIESQQAPQHVISNGRMIEPKYKDKVTMFVNEIDGEYELLIRNVQLNESGWYVCIDDGTSRHIDPYFLNVRVDIASISNHERMSVVNGSDAMLPCRSINGGPMRWLHSHSVITPQYVIFDGSSVEPQYSDRVRAHVDQSAGDFNLSISNVHLSDSGWYICYETSSQHVHLKFLEVYEAGLTMILIVGIISFVGGGCVFSGILMVGYKLVQRRRASRDSTSTHIELMCREEVIQRSKQANELPKLNSAVPESGVSRVSNGGRGSTLSRGMEPLHIIKPDDKVGGRVAGVTSIGDKLYVIRIPTKDKIQVYDKETYAYKTSLDITGLNLDDNDDPWEQGFTSCTRDKRNYLYVSDKYKDKVFAVELCFSEGTPKRKAVTQWDVIPQNSAKVAGPSGLSIGRDGNVIVTCYEDSTIRIYKPDEDPEGERPSIYCSMPTEWVIKRPYHAVELSDGRIAVSHYFPDDKKGVSLIKLVPDELNWEVIQNSTDCITLYFPRYLTVNSKDYIFVVDQIKPEVIGLHFSANDSEKGTSRVFPVLIEDETKEVKSMEEPWCIYLDEGANRLYVGERTGQRVLVFDTSSMSVDDALNR